MKRDCDGLKICQLWPYYLKGCSIVILFMSDMRRLILSMMIYVVKKFIILINYEIFYFLFLFSMNANTRIFQDISHSKHRIKF